MAEPKRERVYSILLLLFYLLAIVLVFNPAKSLLSDPRIDLFYNHIPIVPIITAFLLFRKRKVLFSVRAPAILPGTLIALAGLTLYLLSRFSNLAEEWSISLSVFSAIIFWAGAYLALYGFKSLKLALFPIGFLLFAVPLPPSIMNWLVKEIAGSSVYITDIAFSLIRIPFVREGIEIYLPGYILVVGPECAGWRSSIALIILSLLAGHLFLKKFKHKLLLAAVAIPMIIIKNGIRIVVLYLIAYYIDERFMEGGFIHRSVGYAMFIVVLIIMGLLLRLLEKQEAKESPGR